MLRWKKTARAGAVAGSTDREGYVWLRVAGRRIVAHRLAWFMHHGVWPADRMEVDHIDGNPSNNAIKNLRLATHQENRRNSRKAITRPDRLKGAVLDKRQNRWMARIGIDGRGVHLGSFRTEIDAAMAYDAAAREHFGEFARLNFPEVPNAR